MLISLVIELVCSDPRVERVLKNSVFAIDVSRCIDATCVTESVDA